MTGLIKLNKYFCPAPIKSVVVNLGDVLKIFKSHNVCVKYKCIADEKKLNKLLSTLHQFVYAEQYFEGFCV